MGSFTRKFKRQNTEKEKAPRCCGKHMVMNKAGVWQCKKCGKMKFQIDKDQTGVAIDSNLEVEQVGSVNQVQQIVDVPSESVSEVTE